jgi:predicted dienelactone hydrolase
MILKTRVSLVAMLIGLVVAVSNFGCGGGASSPPPVISVSLSASTITVQAGATTQISATVTNDSANKGVTWTVTCPTAPCGTVSPATTASGVATTYTAPINPPASLTVTITAKSVADATKTASASASVSAVAISVSIVPSTATVQVGTMAQFSATVTGDTTNSGVTWTLTQGGATCSPGCGSVSPANTASGVSVIYANYTAPATAPANPTLTITATSVADPTKSGSASVTVVLPPISVSISPTSILLGVNVTQEFTATVQNDPANKGVTWTLTQSGTACSPACGTISPANSASGTPTTYTAPSTVPANSVVTINAISVADASQVSSVKLTVTSGTVKLVPDSLSFGRVHAGNAHSMTTTLTNTGTKTLSITSMTFTGQAGPFSATNTCGTSVAAGQSCTITVTFKPNGLLNYSATLDINDDSADSPQPLSLSGKGTNQATAAMRSALASQTTAAVPSPMGRDAVGTHVMRLVDFTRDDPFLANGSKRELLVRFWYPATLTGGCKPAEYTSPRVWGYFSELVGIQLPEVTTNSCLDAPIANGPHPVVVFTHGYTGTFTDYTFIVEDLASRGYVVASVDHTYEATAVEFPDGRFVESVPGSHLGNIVGNDEKELSFAVSVRLADLKFIVDELAGMNVSADSPFAGKLDVSRVALAGHSLGGLTALLGVAQEPRFRTGIILDAAAPERIVDATETPIFVLFTGGEGRSVAECRLWDKLRGPRLALNLRGAEHLTPSDAVWLLKGVIKTGDMGPEKTIAALRDYLAAFLDSNLQGQPLDPLLTGPSSEYPDAVVTTQEQPLCRQP